MSLAASHAITVEVAVVRAVHQDARHNEAYPCTLIGSHSIENPIQVGHRELEPGVGAAARIVVRNFGSTCATTNSGTKDACTASKTARRPSIIHTRGIQTLE